MANKPILCLETGTVFDSAKEAAEFVHRSPNVVSACARGLNSTAGGYHWQYVDDVERNDPKKQEVHVKPDKPRSRPAMTITEVQEEARRRSKETGRRVRYKHIQIEETLALIRQRDKMEKLKKEAQG